MFLKSLVTHFISGRSWTQIRERIDLCYSVTGGSAADRWECAARIRL